MHVRTLLIFLFLFNSAQYSQGQDCNCNTTFQWLKKTFEENDAGYKYILSVKGQAAYDYHNKMILERIKAVKSKSECHSIMNDWLHFFRKGHIYIRALETKSSSTAQEVSPQIDTLSIKRQFANWPRMKINLLEFEKYLNKKNSQDYEGVWDSPPYKIAIKKTADGFKGILLNDIPPYWEAGQVKLEIKVDGEQVKGIFYMRDHTKVESKNVQPMGQNYLQVSGYSLKRLVPSLSTEPEVQDYLTVWSSKTPYLKTLDDSTLYLRVPSFDPSQKKAIDSVLSVNDKLLSKSPNLIIDIRGNGGGSDYSFDNIIPYLKTNPISTVGVEYYSTTLNNQRMLDFITNPEYKTFFTDVQKQWLKKSYDVLQNRLGEFVLLDEPVGEKEKEALIQKKEYPRQVGIIIDGGIGSTTEQFLLAARQSKKVKLYGTPTFGSLDVSNMYSVKSPCNDYELGYCLSRSKRIPQYIIDDRGIQPDFFISNETPGFKWVDQVKKIMEE